MYAIRRCQFLNSESLEVEKVLKKIDDIKDLRNKCAHAGYLATRDEAERHLRLVIEFISKITTFFKAHHEECVLQITVEMLGFLHTKAMQALEAFEEVDAERKHICTQAPALAVSQIHELPAGWTVEQLSESVMRNVELNQNLPSNLAALRKYESSRFG